MNTAFKFDSSGKRKEPTAEEWREADEKDAILSLSCGIAADGRPYYAYIAVIPSKYAEFYRLSAQHQQFTLEDYGIIVASDYQATPPQDVADWMRDEYGFDENFQNQLKEQFQKEGIKFLDKQEDTRIMDIVSMLKQKAPNVSAPPKTPDNAVVKNALATKSPVATKNAAATKNAIATKNAVLTKNAAATKNTVATKKPATTKKKVTPKPKSLWTRLFGK
jgi:hypothetical protein